MLGGSLEVVCSSIGPAWDAPFWSVVGGSGSSREMINGSAVATGDGFFNSFAPKEDFFLLGHTRTLRRSGRTPLFSEERTSQVIIVLASFFPRQR